MPPDGMLLLLTKICNLSLTMRKWSDKSRLQDTLQDKCSGPFKNINAKKGETGGGTLFSLDSSEIHTELFRGEVS